MVRKSRPEEKPKSIPDIDSPPSVSPMPEAPTFLDSEPIDGRLRNELSLRMTTGDFLAHIDDSPPVSLDAAVAGIEFRDDARGTWGLHATRVLDSRYTGQGVRVAAIVDGWDANHPDWVARNVIRKSFAPAPPTNSIGYAGTHYLGTAFGIARPSSGARYGCAPAVKLFVASVAAGASGAISRVAILSGIDWALANKCRVILLTLSWDGQQIDNLLEQTARRALASGSVLIAGAGNNAHRPGDLGSVANPARSPSVLGVGSVDRLLNLPFFTPRGLLHAGPLSELVAPGVALRSSTSGSRFYDTWSGSATAASYVAGIATLWAEALPNATTVELWEALTSHARALPHAPADIGAGLIQAP